MGTNLIIFLIISFTVNRISHYPSITLHRHTFNQRSNTYTCVLSIEGNWWPVGERKIPFKINHRALMSLIKVDCFGNLEAKVEQCAYMCTLNGDAPKRYWGLYSCLEPIFQKQQPQRDEIVYPKDHIRAKSYPLYRYHLYFLRLNARLPVASIWLVL